MAGILALVLVSAVSLAAQPPPTATPLQRLENAIGLVAKDGNGGDGGHGITQSNRETEKQQRRQFFFVVVSVASFLCVMPFAP